MTTELLEREEYLFALDDALRQAVLRESGFGFRFPPNSGKCS